LNPLFYEATESDIARAFELAERAFDIYRQKSGEEVAAFLDLIADEIIALDHDLIDRASFETGLPAQRLTGERARTVGQLKMFAGVVREGSWVDAAIDRALTDRKPLPRPDVRRMLIPLGPVVVFGASNFPLAFSVPGGDTASALAAGNPVIVKGHPAHPGTSELVARAIGRAANATGMPAGVFSLLQGTSHELSLKVVQHPSTAAVGFTGSLKAGRALFDTAAGRLNPIPVYAEMGSLNPVFLLPGALRERADAIAEALKQSITVGVGQFCTCPGLVVGLRDSGMTSLTARLEELIKLEAPATMLHPAILRSYRDGLRRLEKIDGVRRIRSNAPPDDRRTQAEVTMFVTEAETFLQHDELGEELFGPATVIVSSAAKEELMRIAHQLQGHLTATIHGTHEDLVEFKDLVSLLQKKVGRLVFNGVPTGVEVCTAMHHGGPYPATSDSHWTSVGAQAIKRFARPICFQDFPQQALPIELRDRNERGIWRTVDDQLTKDEC
jgi:NADP-dependent aldehyde dehydrogenase